MNGLESSNGSGLGCEVNTGRSKTFAGYWLIRSYVCFLSVDRRIRGARCVGEVAFHLRGETMRLVPSQTPGRQSYFKATDEILTWTEIFFQCC